MLPPGPSRLPTWPAVLNPARPFGFLLLWLCLWPVLARGDALVTDCSEAGLRAALGVGGRITFACDGAIVISNALVVGVDAQLDASGHRIALTGVGETNVTNSARFFTISPGVRFTAANFTMTGGRSTNGGAIYNDRGFLTLVNCVFTNNAATAEDGLTGKLGRDGDFQTGGKGANGAAGRAAFGGALYNRLGTTIVDRCLFITNSAIGSSGGAGGAGGAGGFRGGSGGNGGPGARGIGGAIFNSGSLIVSNSTFQQNVAQGGEGGAGGAGGNGTFAGRAGHGSVGGAGSGGAICNTNRGRVFLYSTTFSMNTVRGGDTAAAGYEAPAARSGKSGGAAYGGAISNLGTNAAVNCTFFANRISGGAGGNGAASDLEGGRGGDGGAALGGQIYSVKRVALTNCTLYSGGAQGGTNGAGGGAAINGKAGHGGAHRGGNVANANGAFLLKNCIIADAFTSGNGDGAFTDLGYNLSTDRTMRLRGPGSRTNTAAGIDVPRRNGGLTETIALLAGSPAIDAGDPGFVPATDQRGVLRPYGQRGDIGAYEYGLTLLPPIITTQPISRVAQTGATVSFLVVAAGDPPLTYQWRRSAVAIGGASGPMLTLTNIQSTDAANYDVIVANNSGSVTSSNAALAILGAVVITVPPAPTTVLPGNTAVFSVTAVGDAPLAYQWLFQGVPIPGANLSTLTIVNAQLVNAGPYQVAVANPFSSVLSPPANLTVGTNRPSIVTDPQDVIVDSGDTAVLSVVADGSQPLDYQWYRNDTELVMGGTNSSLVFSNAQPVNDGLYSVVVNNSVGSVTSAPAMLTVNPVAPEITIQPVELLEPCYNDSILLTVAARGTEPLSFQWYLNDVAVPGATNTSLFIPAAQTNHAGSYYVIVSNVLGDVPSETAEVIVTGEPRITVQPLGGQIIGVGSNVVFSIAHCPSPGPFSYQWMVDGEAIPGATNAIFVISSVSVTNVGNYSVLVTNLFGETESDMAGLIVLVPSTAMCENVNVQDEPVHCTITVAARPEYVYSLQFSFDGGGLWVDGASDVLPGDTADDLQLDYVSDDTDIEPPIFRVLVFPP